MVPSGAGGGGASASPGVFTPATHLTSETTYDEHIAAIRDHGQKIKAKQESERTQRAEGKKVRGDRDSLMPSPGMPGAKRGPDGRFVKGGQSAASNLPAPGGQQPPPPPQATNGHAQNWHAAVPPVSGNVAARAGGRTLGDATGAAPAAGAAAAAAAVNGFTQQHYDLGAYLGLSKAQVESFGGAGHFEGWVINNRNAHLGAQQRAEAQRAAAPQWQQVHLPDGRTAWVQGAPQNGQQQNGTHFAAGANAGSPQVNLPQVTQQQLQQFLQPIQIHDEFDPAIKQVLQYHNSILPHVHQRLAMLDQFMPQLQNLGELHQRLARYEWNEQRRQMVELERAHEDAFSAVDKDLFGEGHFSKIEANQKHARVRASDVMSGLVTQYSQRGEALPPLRQLVEMARAAVFPDRVRSQALSQAASSSASLAGASGALPTARTPMPVDPQESAKAKIREFYREQGAPGS